MGKPDDDEGDEEEDASFIVHCVPGCSLHIYDSWKKSQGQNYYSHFTDKERDSENLSKFLKVSQFVEGRISA